MVRSILTLRVVLFASLFLWLTTSLFAQSKHTTLTKNSHEYQERSAPIGLDRSQASVFLEDFNGDNTTAGITARGWVWINSDGGGTSTTFNGGAGTTFPAYEGPINGYIGQNFNGANGLLIDQWLISAELTVEAGDTLSFYWRGASGAWDDSVFVKISEGGSAINDFTTDLGRFKVPQEGWTRFTYVFATAGTKRVGYHYYHTDANTHSNYWGLDYFEVISSEICPVDLASNPTPADGAIDVSGNLTEVSWTNPGNATSNDFYWGTNPGSLVLTQSGTQSSYALGSSLDYRTTYYWRVDEKNDSCTVAGAVWSFTTEANPDEVFYDDFEASTDTVPANWTVVNNGGTLVWRVFDEPWPNTYTLPTGAGGKVLSGDSDFGGATGSSFNSTATLTNPLDLSLFQTVMLEFDSDFRIFDTPTESASVEVSNDGTNWTEYLAYDGTASVRNTNVSLDISATAALQSQVWIRFTYIAGWDWWWVIDNVGVLGTNVVPVELTSFGADVNGSDVVLNWSTATETNNKGFQVERKTADGQFALVGFINGKGTTTETQNYSYADSKLSVGNYTYRLKQIDFDGTFEYSKEVEVEVIAPDVYSLNQNYPNPFNPSTKINFNLASDAAVTLKIFDVLGQEVAKLINGVMKAGAHEINFNASSLNSGVYLYKIEAAGIDGSNFTSVKKMILTK